MKNNLDQFYTREEYAKQCIDIVKKYFNIDEYKILEPSAGYGSFIKYIDNYYACDIDPKNNNIDKKDFLNDDISEKLIGNKILTIGNPPFGKKSKLAIEFINKAFEYSDIVCFILPKQFLKYSSQSRVHKDAKLIHSEVLDENIFIHEEKEYSVRCCFQIWVLNDNKHTDLRIRELPTTTHKDFEMWQYNNTETASKYFNKEIYKWDFAVPRQGYKDYTIKETNPDNMSRKTQWIFFKANNESVLQNLLNIDFVKLSKNNTSTPGFGKADVIAEYKNLYE